MPAWIERSNQCPDRIRRCGKVDAVGDHLQLGIWGCQVRKGVGTRFRRRCRPTLEELADPGDQPPHQNVDDLYLDCVAASGLMSSSANGAFFDLKMAGIGHRLGNIEQKEIVEKDI